MDKDVEMIAENPPPPADPRPKTEAGGSERAKKRAPKNRLYDAAYASRMHLLDLARVYGYEHLTIKSRDLPIPRFDPDSLL
jgi:hypothetical protein